MQNLTVLQVLIVIENMELLISFPFEESQFLNVHPDKENTKTIWKSDTKIH